MMKRITITLCVLVVLSLFTGCGQPSAEEQLLGYWEKIVGILTDNKADPAKAAAALKEYLNANIPAIRELTAKLGTAEGKAALQDPQFIQRELNVRQAIVSLEKSGSALLSDPAVKDALNLIGSLSF